MIRNLATRPHVFVLWACVLLSLSLVAIEPTAARTSRHACLRRGSRTVVETKQVRVFRLKGETYGCLFKQDRARRLGDIPGFPDATVATNVTVAGRYVGYQLKFIGRETSTFNVVVLDLQRGRKIHNVRAGDLLTGENRNVHDPGVTALVLTGRGAVAWIDRNSFADPVRLEVHKADSGGPALLDSGNGIDPSSLAISRTGQVFWLDTGTAHVFQLQ